MIRGDGTKFIAIVAIVVRSVQGEWRGDKISSAEHDDVGADVVFEAEGQPRPVTEEAEALANPLVGNPPPVGTIVADGPSQTGLVFLDKSVLERKMKEALHTT